MIDPRTEAVLIRRRDQPGFSDKTPEIMRYAIDGGSVLVTYAGSASTRTYRYAAANVAILRSSGSTGPDPDHVIRVDGKVLSGVTAVFRFEGGGGTWWRIFWTEGATEQYLTRPRGDVEFIRRAEEPGGKGQDVMAYWRRLASGLTPTNSLRVSYQGFHEVPTGSALELYLSGNLPEGRPPAGELKLPFASNPSQREALEKCLTHRLSVIDGPPGTGKTQTILNLVANIICVPGQTVGVASLTNAAVENVRDKLAEAGLGHVVADLGSAEKRDNFFGSRHARNQEAQDRAGALPVMPPAAGRIDELGRLALRLQLTARDLAARRRELDGYKLEQRHFARHLASHRPAPLPALSLLQRPSGRIIEFLAGTTAVPSDESFLQGLVRRVRSRIRYGSTRSIDPTDSGVVLQLQAAFYAKRIAEVEDWIVGAEKFLEANRFSEAESELKEASRQALAACLHERYARLPRRSYPGDSYLRHFGAFSAAYPVILSTCHSLRRSIPDGYLLDYLIIDEASQVDLLAAGLAMSCARNVIVVGDLRQLPHIPDHHAARQAGPAPAAAFDYVRHSVLSSVIDRFGTSVPRTMLREHYRCDPAIIDFCNRKFYDGRLVPFTEGSAGDKALVVVRTAPGNHMRQHAGGGRTNQREAEVIAQEVLQRFCKGIPDDDIGVVTPYRRQVEKVTAASPGTILADTVHKFQGREKKVMIMSTVLDETRAGNTGIGFVDHPQLVNVAVSRAARRFILVINHDMLPASRHLRDLVHYIQYRNPDDGVLDSRVLSVFDLLYKEYSAALEPLAARVRGVSPHASENIAATVLADILAGEPFSDLVFAREILVRNLLPDLSRLTPAQAAFVRNRASVDFVVYNRVTNRAVLAVEVDGFAYHEADPAQRARDAMKDTILRSHGMRLLRLPTTGSGEEQRIRKALLAAMAEPGSTA